MLSMIASIEHRFVFIHVPKSAGVAIRQALKEAFGSDRLFESWGVVGGRDHAHLLPSAIQLNYPEIWTLLEQPGTINFAVVRNPFARAVAAYLEHCFQFTRLDGSPEGFVPYLEHVASRAYQIDFESAHHYIHGVPQHEFLYSKGRQLVGNIVRLEDGDVSVPISRILGRDVRVPFIHAAQTRFPRRLTSTEISLIREIYAGDFELFQYSEVY